MLNCLDSSLPTWRDAAEYTNKAREAEATAREAEATRDQIAKQFEQAERQLQQMSTQTEQAKRQMDQRLQQTEQALQQEKNQAAQAQRQAEQHASRAPDPNVQYTSRKDAERMILDAGKCTGMFVVRQSLETSGGYHITCTDGSEMVNIPLVRQGKLQSFGRRLPVLKVTYFEKTQRRTIKNPSTKGQKERPKNNAIMGNIVK